LVNLSPVNKRAAFAAERVARSYKTTAVCWLCHKTHRLLSYQENEMKRHQTEDIKVTITVERDGVKTRYKKRFKKGEAMLGRIGDFMVKLQEDKPDEVAR
jgi:hypothetical protein